MRQFGKSREPEIPMAEAVEATRTLVNFIVQHPEQGAEIVDGMVRAMDRGYFERIMTDRDRVIQADLERSCPEIFKTRETTE